MAKSSDVPKYLQEELSQEYKELASTLPTENGWVSTHLHQYERFWVASNFGFQKHFQALDTDVLLVTPPKSGTTWLKAWTFALINRKRYPNIDNHHPLLTNNPHVLVPFLESELYFEKDILPDLNSLSPPRLFSTHMPFTSLPKSVKE